MASPADRVPQLMDDLLGWLTGKEEHPFVASCVFHYELEFIHPFTDSSGRMGRLWQSLILRQWKPLLAYLPVETVIRARQDDYYRVLTEADKRAESTPFIEFILQALLDAIQESVPTDQVSDQGYRTQIEAQLRQLTAPPASQDEKVYEWRPTILFGQRFATEQEVDQALESIGDEIKEQIRAGFTVVIK